jgi:hypothetical protein
MAAMLFFIWEKFGIKKTLLKFVKYRAFTCRKAFKFSLSNVYILWNLQREAFEDIEKVKSI